jgi:hypothetical protein
VVLPTHLATPATQPDQPPSEATPSTPTLQGGCERLRRDLLISKEGILNSISDQCRELARIGPTKIRLILIATFMTSYLLGPLQSPIMLVWARVIESEKPVFTLVFGGIGAALKATQEIISAFSLLAQ